ncbi:MULTISPECIES: fimbria/pilus periplasmic chaperone [Yersinia]|uniref:fimbrial biogenesis chaperone n=1 Tax=Yersinia TaxID=629 RepID=UPI0005E366C3|nr:MULTISPECIES: fimbria/pilus periplasmic chaperone [Yersinia]OVZ96227.1 pilus assembly protein PapD [Yersinia frederiksenii]RXA98044.1 molecular chaperone [Yersinia sp. 2105 StPb PI]CNH97977.1 putative pili chaperone protein [Yersinia frederiksenii]CNI04507.1 putative pili chaperone protein [Yersinia frederiksenii]CNK09972.1 putative pili chaperone protein [Yersinia frederiksenii]
MTRTHRILFTAFSALLLILLVGRSVQASVVISGTRVIYPENQKEVTVKVSNMGKGPVVVQSWIDSGDVNARPETLKVPFVLTPPINRVEPNKSQTLRISYTGATLPKDKESVFWLNVLEIPAKADAGSNQNYLQMAYRSRIKLFFRPQGLTGNPNEAAKSLVWTKAPGGLKVTNPTPFHVSLVTVAVNAGGKRSQVEGQMISPKDSLTFALPGNSSGSTVDIEFVNDYGALNKLSQAIKP